MWGLHSGSGWLRHMWGNMYYWYRTGQCFGEPWRLGTPEDIKRRVLTTCSVFFVYTDFFRRLQTLKWYGRLVARLIIMGMIALVGILSSHCDLFVSVNTYIQGWSGSPKPAKTNVDWHRYAVHIAISIVNILFFLAHWGRVTHICVGNLGHHWLDNGLSPGRRKSNI